MQPSAKFGRTLQFLACLACSRIAAFSLHPTAAAQLLRFTTAVSLAADPNEQMPASNDSSSIRSSPVTNTTIIRVLALHGSEGNGASFAQTLKVWRESLLQEVAIDFQVSSFDAPVPKGHGYAWWAMPPHVRSFNATSYEHFDTSCAAVLQHINNIRPHVILGHSQGAILITALLALNQIRPHPPLGYIPNGVAWPNPYTDEMEALRVDRGSSATTIPKVLLIVGERDKMNPPDQTARVGNTLQQAGMNITIISHPAGHAVPVQDSTVNKALAEWLTSSVDRLIN
jgi:predicted esterase|uniref:Serine hydrolase domain-containing protein n=1 Tax=Phaeodactylum tricornutum TaxID=2850 RepID=A0A8J9S011_PHATR